VEISTFAYPWDIARLGVSEVLDELADLGVDRIAVAATYHPIDAFSPRTPQRLYSVRRGAVLFRPTASRYARIHPPAYSDRATLEVWSELIAEAPRRRIAVDAWVIGLFQPWIVDDHPESGRVLPTGEPLPSGACPASPDVRGYLAALLRDLVDQIDPSVIRFEGVTFRPFDHGWTRPRIQHPIGVAAAWLLGLCFCRSCGARALRLGVALEPLRERVLIRLADALQHENWGRCEIESWLSADDELAEFVADHAAASLELIRELRSSIESDIVLTTLLDPELPGQPPKDGLVEAVDGVMVHPHQGPDAARTFADLARRGPAWKRVVAFVSPAGLGPPRALPMTAELGAAVRLGVDEIAIYNFGLLSPTDFAAAVTTARTVFASAG
jgi:hypothetical protein